MTRCAWIVCVAAALASAAVRAQPPAPVVPGVIAAKLSLRFDFEQDVDRDGFPDEWRAVGGRHPQNIRERRDVSERRGGVASLVVEPDGRTNVYETVRAWPFDARLSWRLSAWIRTRNLPASGLRATVARVEMAGLESDDKPPVFTVSTPGVTGSSDWTEVAVEIPRDVTRPFRTVRLRLVTDGPALSGKVWFDDVAFVPQPTTRVLVPAGREGLLAPDDPRVATVALDTLIDGASTLALRLMGPDGALASARTVVVTPSADFTAEASLDLGVRAFGLYRIEADLICPGRPVMSRVRSVLFWPGPAGGPRRDVGVAAGALSQLTADRVATLVRAPFGTVATEIAGAEESARAADAFARLRQVPGEIEPVVVLDRPPETLVRALFESKRLTDASPASWTRVLTLEPALWSREFAAAVKPLAGRALYYQLGARATPGLPAREIARAVRQLREALAPVTWDRRIALVIDGTEPDEWLAAAGADVLVLDASTLGPGETESRVARLKGKSAEVWVNVSVPGQAEGARKRADVLFERLVRAKAAGADRVIITPLEGGLMDAQGAPTDALSAAATFARELGGKKFVGRLATKTPAYLFGDGPGARVVVFPRGSGASETVPLGPAPARIDLDGNVSSVFLSGRDASLVDLGRPYILTNITLGDLPLGPRTGPLPSGPRSSSRRTLGVLREGQFGTRGGVPEGPTK